jgi:hypothetical protein
MGAQMETQLLGVCPNLKNLGWSCKLDGLSNPSQAAKKENGPMSSPIVCFKGTQMNENLKDITLRDLFALFIINGVLSQGWQLDNPKVFRPILAEDVYDLADELVARRNKDAS